MGIKSNPSQYTKGEWKVKKDTQKYLTEIIIAGSGARIAEMNNGWDNTTIQANANLIAAAPRMAEWLDRLIKQGGWVYQKDLDEAKEMLSK